MAPMFHGTNDEIARRIAENGFGVVAGTDSGFYGRGFFLRSLFSFLFSLFLSCLLQLEKVVNMKSFCFSIQESILQVMLSMRNSTQKKPE